MTNETIKELVTDTKRQAVASLEGYAYQIWQTVNGWINLKKEEVLFLEGAEDIDILGPKKSETIQVKHTKKSRNVTLQSKEILDAISNFWKHQEDNPDSSIELNFLTTAERGKEKHSHFGQAKGLDYWDSCKFTLIDTAPLRDFLKKQNVFPVQLQHFINDSEDSEFRERLIRRIVWNTGTRRKEYLKDLIERNICDHGNRLGIFPSEAKKVIPHLLAHVFEVVCREEDRRLNYRDFLELFENVTTQPVPGGLLNAVKQLGDPEKLAHHLLESSGLTNSKIEFFAGVEFQYLRPQLLKRIVRREELVAELHEHLDTNRFLVLKGSTGMGKSVLARLLISENESDWHWLNFRGFEPNHIREILFRETTVLSKKKGRTKLVIDDLNFRSHSNVYECALESLLFTLLSSGGRVIITTQGDISNRICLNLGINSQSIYDVPPFSHEDIKELAIEYGCPLGSKLKSWSALVKAKTRGHPQLVHAYIKNLNSKKWPSIKADDITAEKDTVIIRREARHRLIDQLPSKEAREFVYKLSMIKFPFRRDHSIELGSNIKNLSNPGEIFDLLIGPWIEIINVDYYRVSPLLDKAAEDTYSSSQLKKFNREISEVFLACKKLTLLEANVILLHGFLGFTGRPIIAMLSSLLRAPEEHWKKIADEFSWITLIAVDEGIKIFPSDPFVNNFLRLFQFRIAVETDSENLAPKIANLWENELDYGQEPKLKILDNITFLIKTLISYEVPFPKKVLIARIIKLVSFIKEYETTFKQPFIMEDSLSGHSFASSLFLFVIIRCRSVNDLDELLTSLESLPETSRNEILALLMTETDHSEVLINNVFLDELNSGSPQWNRLIVVLERTIDLGLSWNVKSLATAGYRTIAVIQDEQQNKSNDALKTLQKAEKNFGFQHPFLGNEKAIILYNQKHYQKALKLWEKILPKWPEKTVFLPIFHLPYVEDCAAKLDRWEKVKEIALQGKKLAIQYGYPVMALGFQADYGFALWKSKDFQGAIKSFADIIDQIPHLPDPYEDIHSYTLQKQIGHTLAWMTQEVGDRVQLAEPRAGCFSQHEVDEKIKEFPLQPMRVSWHFLAELEYKVGSGNTMIKRLKKESTNLNIPFVFFMVEHITIGHSLKGLKFRSLVSELLRRSRSFELNQKHTKAGYGIYDELDLSMKVSTNEYSSTFQHWLPRLLLAALIKLINERKYSTAPISKWKSDSKKTQHWNKNLDEWFKLLESAPTMSIHELSSVLQNGDTDLRCIAAINISANKLVKPSVRFYAELLLVQIMKTFPWIDAIETDIEQLISKNWLEVTSKQSFSLISPNLNSPLIIEACRDRSMGLKKAAKILLASRNAVQISMPDQTLRDLIALADSSGTRNQIV